MHGAPENQSDVCANKNGHEGMVNETGLFVGGKLTKQKTPTI